jgi:hypothetical protein
VWSASVYIRYFDERQQQHIKMKVITFLIFSIPIIAIHAAPTEISENNLGDIVNVNVHADANIRNEINANMIDIILQWINMEVRSIPLGDDGRPQAPNFPFKK